MITVTKRNDAVIAPLELTGKSTDPKPTTEFEGYPIINGSSFFEMDSGNVYWFDGEKRTWIK